MPPSGSDHPLPRALNGTTPTPSALPQEVPQPASIPEWLSILDDLEALYGEATKTLQQQLACDCRDKRRPTRAAIEKLCHQAETERKELLGIYRAVTKLAEIEWEIGLARVTFARKCAAIAKHQTELHTLQLLEHRCEDCSQPLNELVNNKVIRRKNANAQVCGDCAARRKTEAKRRPKTKQ